MAGVVLETLSNRKLFVLSVTLAIILVVFFLIGGLIAPAPSSTISTTTRICIDHDNVWQLGDLKPFIPRANNRSNQCNLALNFDDPKAKEVSPNQIILAQWIPLMRDSRQLDMSRWFQYLISIMDLDISFSNQNRYPEGEKVELQMDVRLFYRDKNDAELDWKLLAHSNELRKLDCSIENDKREEGNLYTCELVSFFELGSVHYDYYLINIRLPIRDTSNQNRFGNLQDLHAIFIFQNGGFTQVWFSMKTVLFPAVVAVLVWFWRRILTQGRSTNLMERTLFSLGVVLSVMNCPIEWLTLAFNLPFMVMVNDLRDGAFYAMLLSFWLIFVGEHMMDQTERNKLSVYWKHLAVIISASLAMFIFEMCERGRQLVNPFYSIWSTEAGATAATGFIIVAGISACLYFVFLCYQVFKVFRNISTKRTSLLHMSSLRRKYYSGLIFRFKFLMIVTLLCAALTVICFIIGQVGESQWKMSDEGMSLEYTSAFLTGVYGMWNVYVIALLCLYAPSHKKFTADPADESTDNNSREEEVQLTQRPTSETSEIATASSLTAFITKASGD